MISIKFFVFMIFFLLLFYILIFSVQKFIQLSSKLYLEKEREKVLSNLLENFNHLNVRKFLIFNASSNLIKLNVYFEENEKCRKNSLIALNRSLLEIPFAAFNESYYYEDFLKNAEIVINTFEIRNISTVYLICGDYYYGKNYSLPYTSYSPDFMIIKSFEIFSNQSFVNFNLLTKNSYVFEFPMIVINDSAKFDIVRIKYG
ncbi:MAG: hypothetical protein QXL82_01765 [Candidatus Aenigmatarchaeota archaeon]